MYVFSRWLVSSEGVRKGGAKKVPLHLGPEASVRWICQFCEKRQASVPGRKEAGTKVQGHRRAEIWGNTE